MSASVKINMAVVSAIIAVVVSVGGVLIGAGSVLATQATHRRDIDRNAERIDSLDHTIAKELAILREQMREDKSELLKAIRETRR